MGLYDSYQLTNSTGIKQYAGSVIPDLVNVSQQLQQRYDQSQDNLDHTSQFLDSVHTLDSDRSAWNRVSTGFKDKINKISQRPDLENAVRDTTMLARTLPTAYAGKDC